MIVVCTTLASVFFYCRFRNWRPLIGHYSWNPQVKLWQNISCTTVTKRNKNYAPDKTTHWKIPVIHICAMSTWKKTSKWELRLLWWPSLGHQCLLHQSSALKLMNLKGGLLCFYLFSDLYVLVLYRLVNPVNQKLNLQTSVNGFSFFYLTR